MLKKYTAIILGLLVLCTGCNKTEDSNDEITNYIPEVTPVEQKDYTLNDLPWFDNIDFYNLEDDYGSWYYEDQIFTCVRMDERQRQILHSKQDSSWASDEVDSTALENGKMFHVNEDGLYEQIYVYNDKYYITTRVMPGKLDEMLTYLESEVFQGS